MTKIQENKEVIIKEIEELISDDDGESLNDVDADRLRKMTESELFLMHKMMTKALAKQKNTPSVVSLESIVADNGLKLWKVVLTASGFVLAEDEEEAESILLGSVNEGEIYTVCSKIKFNTSPFDRLPREDEDPYSYVMVSNEVFGLLEETEVSPEEHLPNLSEWITAGANGQRGPQTKTPDGDWYLNSIPEQDRTTSESNKGSETFEDDSVLVITELTDAFAIAWSFEGGLGALVGESYEKEEPRPEDHKFFEFYRSAWQFYTANKVAMDLGLHDRRHELGDGFIYESREKAEKVLEAIQVAMKAAPKEEAWRHSGDSWRFRTDVRR